MLEPVSSEERALYAPCLDRAVDALELFLNRDVATAMNQFNVRISWTTNKYCSILSPVSGPFVIPQKPTPLIRGRVHSKNVVLRWLLKSAAAIPPPLVE